MDSELLEAAKQQLSIIIKSWKHVSREAYVFSGNDAFFAAFEEDRLILPVFEISPSLIQELVPHIGDIDHPEFGACRSVSLTLSDFTAYLPLIEQSYRFVMLSH
ncbi:MAG: hypothetical protein ACXAE3_10955 [Candidatus Kariarchaeaceae archaeon]|jgi:hypothetical protein